MFDPAFVLRLVRVAGTPGHVCLGREKNAVREFSVKSVLSAVGGGGGGGKVSKRVRRAGSQHGEWRRMTSTFKGVEGGV